jgi:hypothetical protein
VAFPGMYYHIYRWNPVVLYRNPGPVSIEDLFRNEESTYLYMQGKRIITKNKIGTKETGEYKG